SYIERFLVERRNVAVPKVAPLNPFHDGQQPLIPNTVAEFLNVAEFESGFIHHFTAVTHATVRTSRVPEPHAQCGFAHGGDTLGEFGRCPVLGLLSLDFRASRQTFALWEESLLRTRSSDPLQVPHGMRSAIFPLR